MRHPDEGTIHGWLDHALADDEARRVEAHVAECAECAAAVAEARGLIAAASRLLSSLDAADARGPRTAGEPRLNADARGSIGAREERLVAGAWGRWLGWKARVAAVLTVVAAGAIAVSELRGPVGRPGAATVDTMVVTEPVHVDTAPRAPVSARVPVRKPADAAVAERATTSTAASTATSPARSSPPAASPPVSHPTVSPPPASRPAASPPPVSQPVPRRFSPLAPDMARAAPRRAERMAESSFLVAPRPSVIHGRVVSTVGQPVAHASVVFQGTRFGTLTEDDGSYALAVPPALAREKSAVVSVRLIGYKPASKAIVLGATDSANHDFALAPSVMRLSEVVVTSAGRSADDAPPVSDSIAVAGAARQRSTLEAGAARNRPALTLVSSSTLPDAHGRTVRRSVYEVRPGVRVTVEAVRVSGDKAARDTAARGGEQPERASAAATPPAALAAGINSIQWTAEDGTRFTLSGPLPLEELRTLKPLVR